MATLKFFTEEDVDYAQNLAKLDLCKEIQNNEEIYKESANSKDFNFDYSSKEKFTKPEDTVNKMTNSAAKFKSVAVKSRLNPSSSHKFKEGKMRIKQVIKYANDMIEVVDYLDKLSKKKSQTSFVIPLELETRRKRWDDFSHQAQRSIFSLKREVNLLSHKITSPPKKLQDTSLRLLSSVSRSCLHLLKGLGNFADEIRIGQKGNKMLKAALMIAQQILLIMAMGNISLHSKNFSNVRNGSDSYQSEEDLDLESSEILTSELDSEALSLLKPKAIREKLSNLAHLHMLKNKKPKKAIKTTKIISPLKMTKVKEPSPWAQKGFPGKGSSTSSQPLTEELEEGRSIQFIHDSLSPKLLKRNQQLQKAGEKVRSWPRVPPPMPYGLPEKMADAVFERIRPYVNEGRQNFLFENDSRKEVENYSKIELFNESKKKLDKLQERLSRLESAAEQQEKRLSAMTFLKGAEGSPADLDAAIVRAKAALDQCVDDPPSVDAVVGRLRRTHLGETSRARRFEDEASRAREVSRMPNVQEEVRAQKVEFWRSLVQDNDGGEHVDGNYGSPLPDDVEGRGGGSESGGVSASGSKEGQEAGGSPSKDSSSICPSKDSSRVVSPKESSIDSGGKSSLAARGSLEGASQSGSPDGAAEEEDGGGEGGSYGSSSFEEEEEESDLEGEEDPNLTSARAETPVEAGSDDF